MVSNFFLKPFLLLSCVIGNSVCEGVVSKNYRFKTFSVFFLEASSVKTDVSDLIRCSIKCTRDNECGGFHFDKASSSCQCINKSIFDVHPQTKATASSSIFQQLGPKMAINGKTNDMFHSNNEKYPWLAIDLGFYYASDKSSDIGFVYKVTGVSIFERSDCCADRTRDINVRVGMNSPPAEGTGGDAEITVNELCGIFLGPGQTGSTSILTCDEPRFGRFVTLQRVSSVESNSPLNWREVTVHHETSDTDTVKIAVATNI